MSVATYIFSSSITFTLRKWFCGLEKFKNISCRLVLLLEMRETVPGGTVSAWRPRRVRTEPGLSQVP